MHRTGIAPLVVLATVVLAGCGASAPAGSATPSTDVRPTTSPPPTTGATPPDHTPLPDRTIRLPGGPKERPERPERLNLETVREYVHTIQYRYAYNELWMGPGTDVELTCEVQNATELDVGYKVVVGCTGHAQAGGETRSGSTATSTVIHADYFTRYFTYFVDEDSTVRRQATDEEAGRGT